MNRAILYLSAIIFTFSTLVLFAQQYEDVVYLKNGSIIHGVILELVPEESIKIQTKDGNTFFFKMNEVKKITKEEIVIKKEEIKKVEIDSTQIKLDKLKSEINKKKKKIPTAENSLTLQPLGLATLLTNIEYDRALTSSFSMGLKISFMTFLLRNAITFTGDPDDVRKAELMKESLSAWGIGTHMRLYTGGKAVEGFFVGLAIEKISMSGDDLTGEGVKKEVDIGLIRLEFEIGNRIKLSSKQSGFTILWTLGAGVGFASGWGDKGDESSTVPIGSIGFGLGYSF
ncbi:MAG: hypothetical protein IAE90_11245 [Ignavibacteria bacterium]|nr:hypothetical protein [Ignavibacteria bacterium]